MISQEQPVLLVVPPFRSVLRPAIGVSQMKANLLQRGIRAEILYLNMKLADCVGIHLYEKLGARFALSLGDFIFSCLLFERSSEEIERYVREVLRKNEKGNIILEVVSDSGAVAAIEGLVHDAGVFAEAAVNNILGRNPFLVGVTSSFQDNLASLLLIRRLKQKNSGILTAMGGANCQGEMGKELFAQFPEIDFVGQGECDHSFAELVEHLRSGEYEHQVSGILSRTSVGEPLPPRMLSGEELEQQPFPDFGDFFEQASALQCRDQFVPGLLMETSRGCHWGERRQCRFCGLNGEQIAFRSKSSAQVLAEIKEQTSRYNTKTIEVVDNMVDKAYFRDLFHTLADNPVVGLFWETSGSLSRDQTRLLAAANVTHVQAGIESLSDKSLRLMDKPTTTLHNLQTLKWCSESGVTVFWSHLFGVPGESEEEVGEIASLMEQVHHLKPPAAAHLVRLQRFSSYFNSPEEYGLAPNYPVVVYRHLYPFSVEKLGRIAYHFMSDYSLRKAGSTAYRALADAVREWRRGYKRAHLIALPAANSLTIIDTRRCARRWLTRLTGLRRGVYERCDRARGLPGIMKELGAGQSESDVEATLQSLVEDRLMLHLNDRYLSLATKYGKRYGKHSIFDGGQASRMPGGHLRPMRLREALRLVRRLRVSPGRLLSFSLRKAPVAFSFAWQEMVGGILARGIRAMTRLLYGHADKCNHVECREDASMAS